MKLVIKVNFDIVCIRNKLLSIKEWYIDNPFLWLLFSLIFSLTFTFIIILSLSL